MRWIRILLIIASLPIAAATVFLAVGYAFVTAIYGFDPTFGRFDAARWKAQGSDKGNPSPRYRMLGSIEERLRPGMTRVEVEALLGEPDERHGLDYYSGLGTMFPGIDYDSLVIEFDVAGKLKSYRISQG